MPKNQCVSRGGCYLKTHLYKKDRDLSVCFILIKQALSSICLTDGGQKPEERLAGAPGQNTKLARFGKSLIPVAALAEPGQSVDRMCALFLLCFCVFLLMVL